MSKTDQDEITQETKQGEISKVENKSSATASANGRVVGRTWADLVSAIPVWIIAISLLATVGLLATLVFSSTERSAGVLGTFGTVEPNTQSATALFFRSDAKRYERNSQYEIIHDLGATPDLIQAWTSVSASGPWELVDSTLAFYTDNPNRSEGIWIRDLDDTRFLFNTGQVSAHSTHGNRDTAAWAIYGHTVDTYNPRRVWVRFTAIAFCIDEGDCP